MKRRTRVNFYQGESNPARVWLTPVLEDGHLYFLEAATHAVGERPEWLKDEVLQSGWDGMLSVSFSTITDSHGISHSEGGWVWLLEHGIAPHQTFLVEIGVPEWYRSSYEYDEYDIEYADYEILQIEPIPEHVLMRRLESTLKDAQEIRADKAQGVLRHRELMEFDLDAMYLRYDTYYPRGIHGPTGMLVRLHTHHGGSYLTEGRDDDNKREVAMDNLVEAVKRRYPHIDEDRLRAMPSWR